MWKTTDRYIQQVWVRLAGRLARGSLLTSLPFALFDFSLYCDALNFLFSFLQKRLKAAEADSKLKQVYIPT